MDFRTKEEQVADFLREGILSGRFPRGSRLKQVEIAALLNTSITPVREALKLLEAEGYVAGSSFKGAMVVPFDASAPNEILALRLVLETQLVGGAVERFNSDDIDELRRLADEFHDAAHHRDSTRARGTNYRFHRRLYQVAEMPQTRHFVQVLWARYPFDIITRIEGRAERAAAEHADLLGHMIAGDADGAVQSTRRHIERGWSELHDFIGRNPQPEPAPAG